MSADTEMKSHYYRIKQMFARESWTRNSCANPPPPYMGLSSCIHNREVMQHSLLCALVSGFWVGGRGKWGWGGGWLCLLSHRTNSSDRPLAAIHSRTISSDAYKCFLLTYRKFDFQVLNISKPLKSLCSLLACTPRHIIPNTSWR